MRSVMCLLMVFTELLAGLVTGIGFATASQANPNSRSCPHWFVMPPTDYQLHGSRIAFPIPTGWHISDIYDFSFEKKTILPASIFEETPTAIKRRFGVDWTRNGLFLSFVSDNGDGDLDFVMQIFFVNAGSLATHVGVQGWPIKTGQGLTGVLDPIGEAELNGVFRPHFAFYLPQNPPIALILKGILPLNTQWQKTLTAFTQIGRSLQILPYRLASPVPMKSSWMSIYSVFGGTSEAAKPIPIAQQALRQTYFLTPPSALLYGYRIGLPIPTNWKVITARVFSLAEGGKWVPITSKSALTNNTLFWERTQLRLTLRPPATSVGGRSPVFTLGVCVDNGWNMLPQHFTHWPRIHITGGLIGYLSSSDEESRLFIPLTASQGVRIQADKSYPTILVICGPSREERAAFSCFLKFIKRLRLLP
jgi:hypothetical protein